MTSNAFKYIAGVVRIKISGSMPEKFINLCIIQNIYLWGIIIKNNSFFAYMRLDDFFSIRPLVRISGNRVEVVSYYGLPFIIKRIKQRKMMVIGSCLFLFLLNFLASYIWFIDIVGIKTVPYAVIHDIVYQNGLKPGAIKDDIDAKLIENQILINIPEVAWAGVNFTGIHAVVEIVEKTLPIKGDKTPADIVAAKDGIITEIIALAGQSVVKKGDTVKKGDILIRGIPYETRAENNTVQSNNNIPPQPIRAHGIIKARVWYENYGEAELLKNVYERTGQQEVEVTLKIGPQELVIKKANVDPAKQFETEVLHKKLSMWRNHEFAVESIINTYHELQVVQKELTWEEAKEEATAKAMLTLQNEVPESAQVVARNIELLKNQETNLVRVKASIETIEDIGQIVNTP